MSHPRLGIVIGATFGLIYVVVNAGQLESTIARLVQAAGMAGFVAVLWLLRSRPVSASTFHGHGRDFAPIVLAEVIAIVAGIVLLEGAADLPTAVLPWVSLVVGVHFVALAHIWRAPPLTWLGVGIAACGAVGLALAFQQASFAVISTVAGIGPGALLLAGSLWGARQLTVMTAGG